MRAQIWGAVALTWGLSACGGMQVNSDYNADVDFTAFRTFAWAEGAGTGDAAEVVGELVDARFRRAVESVMVSKGMEQTTSGQPDVFIGYQITLDDQVSYQTVNSYYGSGWGYRGVYGGQSTSRTTATQYTVGTLVIDVFDARQRELVWRGVGEAKVDANESRTPAESQERANQVAMQILEDFPAR